jgi:DHA1 family multidrug resistance protein-like MFS transporter
VFDLKRFLPNILWRKGVLPLVLITLCAEIAFGVLNYSTMPLYLEKDRHFRASLIGLVFVAFLISEAMFKGTMGHLADRYGRRRMMVIGPAITTFTPLITIAIPLNWRYSETLSLILLRICDGLAAAMIWPAAYALVGELVEEKEQQEGLSLLNMCFMLGIALAMPIGGYLNDYVGDITATLGGKHTPSLYLASFMFIAVAVLSYIYVPSGKDMRIQAEEKKVSRLAAEEGTNIRHLVASLHRIPKYLLLGFVTFAGIGFPLVNCKSFAMLQFSLNESQFGLIVLPGALAMAALSVPLGKLGQRIGNVRTIHLGMMLCVIGLGIIGLGAFSSLFRTAWCMALGGIPLGVGFLVTIPAWYSSVSSVDPTRCGANIGAVMTAQGLGAIVGMPLGAAAYEHLQTITVSFGRYSPFIGSFICLLVGWLVGLKILKEAKTCESESSLKSL